MPSIAQRVAGTATTIFTEINILAQRYDAINLGQGRPDFDGPDSVIEAAVSALRSGHANQYPHGYGISELRQAISHHSQRFYGMDIDPEQGVIVTAGASEGIYSAIMGIVNPGDEVILIEPYFDIYLPAIEWAGGKPVYVPLHPPSWTLDPDELRAAFGPRTRAIIVNSPHNPTGRVFSAEELALIAELCQEHDVIVIADEVYEHLTFDGIRHQPLATLPGMFERTITVSSAAKTFSVTGWKVGWTYGHPDLIAGVWRVHQNITFAVHHPSQFAIAHALMLDDSYYAGYQAAYTQKRDILHQALTSAGLKADAPEGAFYIMADFSELHPGDDLAFARYLIEEAGVACIPPSTFYSPEHQYLGKKHVRFAFCKHDEVLHAAGERLLNLRS